MTTLGELLGAAVFSIGVWQFSPALGLMSFGATITGVSWLAAQ